MSVAVWRIAVEASTYAANDLSGVGTKITGGRWNSMGTLDLYCASNIALATLETVHYLRSGGLSFNRYLIRIDIPHDVWAACQVLDPLPSLSRRQEVGMQFRWVFLPVPQATTGPPNAPALCCWWHM